MEQIATESSLAAQEGGEGCHATLLSSNSSFCPPLFTEDKSSSGGLIGHGSPRINLLVTGRHPPGLAPFSDQSTMRTLLWARFSHFSKKSRRTRRQAGFTFPFPLPTLLHARLDVSPKGVTVFGDKEENEELSDELTTMLFRVQRSNRVKQFLHHLTPK